MGNQIVVGLVASVIATGVAAGLTPLVRAIALSVGAVDAPGERRVHKVAIPRMGGVAIFVATAVALALVLQTGLLQLEPASQAPLYGYALGGIAIFMAGIYDDLRSLGAKRKLLAQLTAATLAWYGGARVYEVVHLPLLGATDFGPFVGYLATVLWILAITNAINLIDGLDGLAGGLVFFAALTNVVIALITGNLLAAAVNGALAGAVLGFLFYNFNPAKIFMGDTGSLFLGYALSAGALLTSRQKESTLASLLVPLIALGVPLTDTLLAMLRRVVARRSIFSADRHHLHHRLLDLGLTHKHAVLVLYGCSVLLCGTAIAAAFGKDWQVGAALFAALFVIVGIVRFAGYFELMLQQRASREHLYTPATQSLRKALPTLVRDVDGARNAASVFAALEACLDEQHFLSASIYAPGEGVPLWTWGTTASGRLEGRVRERTFEVGTFPGADKSTFRVTCLVQSPDVPPQLDVLLQIVADVAERALMRVNAQEPESMLRVVGVAKAT